MPQLSGEEKAKVYCERAKSEYKIEARGCICPGSPI